MQKLIQNILRLMAVYFFCTNMVLFIDKIANGLVMSSRNPSAFQNSSYEVFLTFFPVVTIVLITLLLFLLAEQLSKLIVGNIPADEMLMLNHINFQFLANLGIFLIGLQTLTEGLVGVLIGAFYLSQSQMLFTLQDFYSIFMTVAQPLLKLILGSILIFSAKAISLLFKDSVRQ